MHTHNEPARLAAGPEDYARFKLTKGRIEQWEDGVRLDPAHRTLSGGTLTPCWTTAPT